jgi:aspartate-semialdehyde dehydrogenase
MIRLAIVGATGLVGQTMLKVLEERDFPFNELYLVASSRSRGKSIQYQGKTYTVHALDEFDPHLVDIAIFSAGGSTSKTYAPRFAEANVFVIDNSSAWRMEPHVPLVVPEINTHTITEHTKIIANPNCSTIQMVMALKPLHDRYHLKRIFVSTYQSVTGAGYKAVQQLKDEMNGIQVQDPKFPHPIAFNCLPHIDVFQDNGFTREELKMVYETRKILEDDSILVSPTAVRLPVDGGHSEAIMAEFENEPVVDEVRELLAQFPGVTVIDNPQKNEYPMPLYARDKDDVFVGRIRKDLFNPRALHLWVVADNLRKGAATNAVQIAEYVMKTFFKEI